MHKITRLKQVHRRKLEEVAARLGPEFMNFTTLGKPFLTLSKHTRKTPKA